MIKALTMLVDEHTEGDSVGIETIQEVLNVATDEGVKAKLILVLDYPLGHSRDYIIVPVPYFIKHVQKAEKYSSKYSPAFRSEI